MSWITAARVGSGNVPDKTINLTVIGDRACSTTRTYLVYLRQERLSPRCLWLIRFAPVPRRLRRLRSVLGARLADALMSGRGDTDLPREQGFADLCLRLQAEAGFEPIDYFSPWRPAEYAERVESFSASDFHDPYLQRRITGTGDTAFLYTNGGIVPASLLARPGVRILHVHPGIVPEMRGSDCLLWSALVRRRIGVSCFYMSPGIDEGEVIGQREFDLPRLPSLTALLDSDREEAAYRALLFAVDPHFRAQLLVEVLRAYREVDLRHLPARAQPPAPRPPYLWMHPRLRLRAIREAFL